MVCTGLGLLKFLKWFAMILLKEPKWFLMVVLMKVGKWLVPYMVCTGLAKIP